MMKGMKKISSKPRIRKYITDYKEYEYSMENEGDLVATAKCDYEDFHANAKIVVVNDDFFGLIRKGIANYTINDKTYENRLIMCFDEKGFAEVKEKQNLSVGMIEHFMILTVASAYEKYSKRLKKKGR